MWNRSRLIVFLSPTQETVKHKLPAGGAGERIYILVLEEEDETVKCLTHFVERKRVTAASVSAIGAFRSATIAIFEFETKHYRTIPVEVQSEVLSMLGDVGVDESGRPSVHLRVVLSLSDGSTRGGHFLADHIQPALEFALRETPAELKRTHRPHLATALIDLTSYVSNF